MSESSGSSQPSETTANLSDWSLDEGEGAWDVLGRSASDSVSPLQSVCPLQCVCLYSHNLCRMNSVRRSSRFNKPQLSTVTLTRAASGYGLELQGKSPPIIAQVCECLLHFPEALAYPNSLHSHCISLAPSSISTHCQSLPLPLLVGVAEGMRVRQGDRLLEVNGQCVRGLSHKEAGKLIAECPESVTLLVNSHQPIPVPQGNVVYSGWLSKKGGSGITPRNWRRRWFVVRDDCIAYYYTSPEV